jgi:peptidyl-dipeptidase A
MLKLGSSKHWSHALFILTEQKSVSASAILKYFKPLIKWLKVENSKLMNGQVKTKH